MKGSGYSDNSWAESRVASGNRAPRDSPWGGGDSDWKVGGKKWWSGGREANGKRLTTGKPAARPNRLSLKRPPSVTSVYRQIAEPPL